MTNFLFKDRDGQTPLPRELQKGLKIKTIQTVGELDEHEEANIARGINWLSTQRKDPRESMFWIRLHKKLFEDVWTWAGKIRDHELDNVGFIKPYQIRTELFLLESNLKTWTDHQSFPPRTIAARFHERLETIHPFANGNGRFGRIIVEHFCRTTNAEIPLWGRCQTGDPGRGRKTYIDALETARWQKNHSLLSDFMFS
ncbi:mobile mystery protein B [Oligoflexus tunisiensis]|uniref:mobile mystery protein B n=1 Tax=Oligoflexus tunisiensis TaxID=708132 RepID=UPI00159F0FAD|nr:mobile mystery protein B [Oligoflexus tunisiensis]